MRYTHYINSAHAVKVDAAENETVLKTDDSGNITVSAGDVLVFKNPTGNKNLSVTQITFKTDNRVFRVRINDNEMYPLIVPVRSQYSMSGLAIYKLTILSDCTFAYDALA